MICISTSGAAKSDFVGFVEGCALFKQPKPGVEQHISIGSDGIAVSQDGSRLYYTPLAGRRL
jgi:hypothetical protein